eukprot:g3469.t1
MLSKYIYGCSSVLFTYDITDMQSFRDIEDWLISVQRLYKKKKKKEMPKLFLLGNKFDLKHLRKVSENKHNAFVDAHELDDGYIVSAKSGDQVVTVLHKVVARTLGVKLSQYEIELTKRTVGVKISKDDADDSARTKYADQIEAEDAALEAKQRRNLCNQCVCSIQ